ncbi:Glucosamine inositolphosphorylceramide transferase 1 [Ancistrocladus abbreviatus]
MDKLYEFLKMQVFEVQSECRQCCPRAYEMKPFQFREEMFFSTQRHNPPEAWGQPLATNTVAYISKERSIHHGICIFEWVSPICYNAAICREHPDWIVGFYPQLIRGSPLKYRDQKYARGDNGYNMILKGAAFIDSQLAFKRYWSEEARPGRMVVDKYFNFEDVLLNYLSANASSSPTVEYVKPAWATDTSKFSSVAISRDTNMHYRMRSECLSKFSELYGSISNRKSEFNSRKDGWDV